MKRIFAPGNPSPSLCRRIWEIREQKPTTYYLSSPPKARQQQQKKRVASREVPRGSGPPRREVIVDHISKMERRSIQLVVELKKKVKEGA